MIQNPEEEAMSTITRIALIGDYDETITAHRAIPLALDLAAIAIGCTVAPDWIATGDLADSVVLLADYNAIWCTPGSPYASMDGALNAIRYAREHGLPFLGTCGGFQHALIEYARNVLGLAEADHAESNPDAALLLITPLSCSLTEATGEINLHEGCRIRAIYAQAQVVEGFNCNYGVNPEYQELLRDGKLHISATDDHGDLRAVELGDHPFFIAVLFQPERSALHGVVHPLISAYLQAASSSANNTN
jgi:CTP synthase (UTP-ammonia lyase)